MLTKLCETPVPQVVPQSVPAGSLWFLLLRDPGEGLGGVLFLDLSALSVGGLGALRRGLFLAGHLTDSVSAVPPPALGEPSPKLGSPPSEGATGLVVWKSRAWTAAQLWPPLRAVWPVLPADLAPGLGVGSQGPLSPWASWPPSSSLTPRLRAWDWEEAGVTDLRAEGEEKD